jgi:hypothetical protein
MSRERDAMLEWSAVATAGSDSEVRTYFLDHIEEP